MEQKLKEILQIALKTSVTDIHFNLKDESELSIEMRVMGNIKKLKGQYNDIRLFRYLMYRANLDLSNAMEPQTGRFEIEINKQKLALRFAIVSSYHVVSGVLRILNNHKPLCIDSLTYDFDQIQWLKNITVHRNGLYVFAGPTGSGKTTTLYTILNEAKGKKIFTLEDPVEIYTEKYIQLSINDKQHLSYSDGIKQLMRHDPDIIMIGEIRDNLAAEMAVRCALTGHLVVTSIHSFSCMSTIQRLLDLGVNQMQLFDVLNGISCQRLYDTEDGKMCIYETITRKELEYYLENKRLPETHISLQSQVRKAVEQKIITYDQAKQDLD